MIVLGAGCVGHQLQSSEVMLRNEAQDHDCIGCWMCRVPVSHQR